MAEQEMLLDTDTIKAAVAGEKWAKDKVVILGKQLFSGLVGSSGNRRVAFASLSDFDIEVGYWQFV